eukprot:3026928-Rhodomonas_salina.1
MLLTEDRHRSVCVPSYEAQEIWLMPPRFWLPIRLAKQTDSLMSHSQADRELVDSSVGWDTHGTMQEHSRFYACCALRRLCGGCLVLGAADYQLINDAHEWVDGALYHWAMIQK